MTPRGRFALKLELVKRGISEDIIQSVLKTISDEEEFAVAKKIAKQKQQTISIHIEPPKQKEKLFRFLTSRGFEKSITLRVLQEILDSPSQNS